jgi:2-polyprenyl-3-methyl-5-hydroxy-6-metoxy-1,4-benzoquinol methylase
MNDFTYQLHTEKSIDDFTALDGTIRFYGFVKAIMLRSNVKNVLDFGAGRGAFWHDSKSVYKRQLQDLRSSGATVTAADVDEAVMEHPCSHQQVMIKAGSPLPFDNGEFDLIVSDMTFEHLENPDTVAKELLRVLKSGGYICARTPNRFGYVRLISTLLPNRLHGIVLKSVQPDRKTVDVFPTFYRLNSPQQAKRVFSGSTVSYYYDSATPSYYLGNPFFYRTFALLHRILPPFFATSVCLFIRKQ